jgi:hypothetical protein
MANISSLISLDSFVNRLLAKEGNDNEDYLRYMQIAAEGLREMYIHDFHSVATKIVTVNTTTNSFAFPTDFVKYIAIATPIDGRWWTYTRDDTMVPLNDDDSTAIQTSLPNVSDYHIADSLGQAGGWNKYYFTPDYKNRVIQVGGFTPDIVVLRYVSNGIDSTGSITVPDYAIPCLEAYVRYCIADFDQEAESRVERLKRRYDEQRRKMRQVQRPTLLDIIDSIYKSSGQLMR